MGARKSRGRLELRRLRRDATGRWHGAAWLTALAATDVAYRMLMRQHVRRALGMETSRA
jgi:hypothetical protein